MFALSKPIVYGFVFMYILYVLASFAAWESKVMVVIYDILFLILSAYLSTLFVYKLYQINLLCAAVAKPITMKNVNSASNPPNTSNESNVSPSAREASAGSISSDKSQYVEPDFDQNAGSDKARDDFLSLITKSTILGTISILTSVISLTSTLSLSLHYSLSLWYFWDIFVLLDVYTNFFCVYLCRVYTKKYYLRCCGRCDILCRSKCSRFHQNQANELSDHTTNNTTQSV